MQRSWLVILGMALWAGAPGVAAVAKAEGPSLSLVEPAGSGCRWVRYDPATRTAQPIANFRQPAAGAHVAWNPAGDHGLVWFSPDEAAAGDRPALQDVTIATGSARAIPLPPSGRTVVAGYDRAGQVVALTLETPPVQADGQGRSFRADGRRFAVPEGQEGIPGLARAYRYRAGHWQREASAQTTTGWDYGRGVEALELASQLGPRSEALIADRPGPAVEDSRLLARLRAFAPALRKDDGEWHQVGEPGQPVYVWAIAGEFLQSTARLALVGPGGGLVAPAGLGVRPDAPIATATAGPYLLVAADGLGGRPRLYDLRNRQRVYASDRAVAACFWPVGAGARLPVPGR